MAGHLRTRALRGSVCRCLYSRARALCVRCAGSVIVYTYVKTRLFYTCSDTSENKGKTFPGRERVNTQRMRSLDSQWGQVSTCCTKRNRCFDLSENY